MSEDGESPRKSMERASSEDATIDLSVPEMDCPTCAKKVESSLQTLDGLESVSLQPTSGMVSVEYDSVQVSNSDVVEAIEGAGYEVTSRTGKNGEETADVRIAPPAEVWTSPRGIKTWVGAVFVTLGLVFEFILAGEVVLLGNLSGYSLTLADGLFLLAVVVSGYPVIRSGYYSARNRSLDIDLLMGTAIIAATGIGYYVEAATLAVLFSVAELLEQYAMDRARDSLRELMELSPDVATVYRDGEERTVPAEDIEIGETVIVRPGTKIPLDGKVTEGESAVDESPITGESVPVDKTTGEVVYAGSINEEGYLEIEVTSKAGDSTLARIIELVQGAQEKKTEREQFVDRFAGYYTPVVVVLAILTASVPPLLLGWEWQTWFIRGLTLLVIACPCAFVISTPVSVVSGITSAAKNGVLIKGGNHLETMGEIEAIALDKTGTLTRGNLAVTDIIPLDAEDEATLLRIAANLERRSEHPIAQAIVERADNEELPDGSGASNFENLPGKGIRADIEGETIYVGNPGLFEEFGLERPDPMISTNGGGTVGGLKEEAGDEEPVNGDLLSELRREGKTVVLVGSESRLIGVLGIADEVRDEARAVVEGLKEMGVAHVTMLTGDNDMTARAIAEQVGVDEYEASLLPEEKVNAVESLQAEYGQVAMVGDGINDAPALATADVGVAMGAAGADTAIETADIALMGDDIGKLPYLYGLSRKANGVIRQNIWASLGVKALLAIGVPLGYVSVALAVVVGDMGMSLSVTGNAMRLSRIRSLDFGNRQS